MIDSRFQDTHTNLPTFCIDVSCLYLAATDKIYLGTYLIVVAYSRNCYANKDYWEVTDTKLTLLLIKTNIS